ncbi:hypothetical protein ACQP2T_60585 [Nonomuraea sp. CA-143628]|uniref:hypothetical protein n=1 Tax=Nonomuraea sp. CA-143628 TaxID=3239997 RepID=UPI003D8C9D7B
MDAMAGIASTEITAGWHHSAGNDPPAYGYSATLTVAARTRPFAVVDRAYGRAAPTARCSSMAAWPAR